LSSHTKTFSGHIFVHSEDLNVRLKTSPQFRYTTYIKRTAKTRNYATPHSPVIPSPLDSVGTHLPGTTTAPDILASRTKCVWFPPLVLTFPEIMHLGSGTKVHYLVFLTNFVHLVGALNIELISCSRCFEWARNIVNTLRQIYKIYYMTLKRRNAKCAKIGPCKQLQ